MRCGWCQLAHDLVDHGPELLQLSLDPHPDHHHAASWAQLMELLKRKGTGPGRRVAEVAVHLNNHYLSGAWVTHGILHVVQGGRNQFLPARSTPSRAAAAAPAPPVLGE